jgi:hypothetical protein
LVTDSGISNLPEEFKYAENVILKNSQSVGKLAVIGELHFRGSSWVHEKYAVTCSHCIKDYEGRYTFKTDKWEIDFNGVRNSKQFKVKHLVEKIKDNDATRDLVRLKLRPELHNPESLEISTEPLVEGQQIYVLGFPSNDPKDNPDSEEIFSDFYGNKVFMPGKIVKVESPQKFIHDCSTLPGVSGGPIFDFTSGKIIGIHQWGQHKRENWGIPVEQLINLINS